MSSKHGERFFLYGYYGQGNLGDDLLMRAAIEGIQRICPGASFVVRNEGSVTGLDTFAAQVDLTGIDRIFADQSQTKVRRLVETLRAYHRHFRGCGWFVFGGGTLFHERRSIAPIVLLAMICLLARLMGLRIVALGVGVAELRSTLARIALWAIVSMSALFAVRDDAALAECKKAGVGGRIKLTDDLAFTLAPVLTADKHAQKPEAGGRRIGVSIYPPALLEGLGARDALAALQSAVSILVTRGWRVSLLVFHDNPEKADALQDRGVLARLASDCPPDRKALVTEHTLAGDVATISNIFSDIDVHCGMRFHGHVLSAIHERPFVGISIDNKIDAICRLFGMPVFAVNEFSDEGLVDAIDRASREKIDPVLRDACIAGAQQNFIELARLLTSKYTDAKTITAQ